MLANERYTTNLFGSELAKAQKNEHDALEKAYDAAEERSELVIVKEGADSALLARHFEQLHLNSKDELRSERRRTEDFEASLCNA